MKMSLLLVIYLLTTSSVAFSQSVDSDHATSDHSHLSTENPNVGTDGKEG